MLGRVDSCTRRTNPMARSVRLFLTLLALVATLGCDSSDSTHEDQRAAVETALDTLAADLLENRPPDVAAYRERLQGYLDAYPAFFGSAAALLDPSGRVVASPYVYRTPEGYASADLAEPAYQIEAQDWFTAPVEANKGIWTEPYFDAGGGEVWMITRSVPVRDAQGLFAIITTDLTVDEPTG